MPFPPNATLRERIHHVVRREFTTTVLDYYRKNPQHVDDERGREGLKNLLKLMENTLSAIDVELERDANAVNF